MGRIKPILQVLAISLLVVGIVVPFFIGNSAAIAKTENPYVVRTFIDGEGNEIVMISVPGRPPETKARAVAVPEPNAQMGIHVLVNIPAFDWSYGCSATAAAMLFGYYDRTGYSNMYTGPTNGGVCPLDNSAWGLGECSLSATHMGYDGLAVRGHVDDYWIAYESPGPDPWEGNWTEHTQGDCTADYMGTNQWKYGSPIDHNVDGETLFYFEGNGSPVVDYTGSEPTYRDGCHGMRLFAESRGYSVVTNYSQLIYGYGGNTLGFTFNDYMAEIDAGRPVIIQVEGHSMLGYGYNTTGQVVYIHDTWDHLDHTMSWGSSYSGRQHYGVSVIQLVALPGPTEVWVDDDYTLGGGNDGHEWGYDAFATIQEGIDAVSGSTVHVAEGYYTEIVFLTDGVELLGAGAGVTTIDGGGIGSVVTTIGVGPTTVLSGFTITNGDDSKGGGMYNDGSSPTVSDCTFIGNTSVGGGGGMCNEHHSSPTVTDCVFSGNTVSTTGGGMDNMSFSSPTVTNCTFSGNSAVQGGGMRNYGNCSPSVSDCTFSGNTAYSSGGGMFNDGDSSPTVTNCTFDSNSASGPSGKGGVMYNGANCSPTLTNCTFSGNSANDYGGGMYNYLATPTVTNCTLVGNSAGDSGGGMYNLNGSSPTVTNCILWDGGDEIYNVDTSDPVVTYCDVQGGYTGTGNTDVDPLFVDAGTGDYHLQSGSPCIDVGNNSAPSIPSTDFEGDPRIMDGNGNTVATVDMGVDEYAETPVFGQLRLQTSPAVPTTISIDGVPRSAWGLDWVKMPPGEYTLSFTDTFGYLAPEVIEVTYPGEDAITQPVTEPITIYAGETTEVMVHCIQLGNLWVRTDPMVSTIISLDGTPPSNNWGFWVDLLPGDYNLSISDVTVYKTPIVVEVTYPGEAPVMQAITDPITVEPGGTTAVVIHFERLGNLKVETSPNLAATIFVDGEPMNAWGFWVDLEAGDYTVSFEDMNGYLTPPPTVVTITAGVTTYVTADYDNGQTIVN
jgi:parallel beta-helix repeat protein